MSSASRVAALYDIHGNLPALEAVLEDVRKARVDLVVIGARNVDAERIRSLRAACASQGIALTRLTVGMEDLIVPFSQGASRTGNPHAG